MSEWGSFYTGAETYLIDVEKLHPHPENPRKDLGDLSELADSIFKNGIMQNLTVFPDPEHKGEYIILIGHRRAAAAAKAGVQFVPCRVIDPAPERKVQLQIMLEENMQRNDLTILEQAETFQLMLDLGDTVAQIAEKSGFSESTIRHRVKIAQLDKRAVRKERDWQLSLSDFVELEKIKSVTKRNEILRSAWSAENLRSQIGSAVRDENREANLKILQKAFKARGIEEAPAGTQNHLWDGRWETLQSIDLGDEDLDGKIFDKIQKEASGRKIFWVQRYSEVKLIVKEEKKQKELSEAERKEKERAKNQKQLKAILKEIKNSFDDEIDAIIFSQRKPDEDPEKITVLIYNWLLMNGTYISRKNEIYFFSEAAGGYKQRRDQFYRMTEDEKKAAEKLGSSYSLMYRMLVQMADEGPLELTGYMGEANEEKIKVVWEEYGILRHFGYSIQDREWLEALNGTSSLYYRKEEK